jgi:hypothetical protein
MPTTNTFVINPNGGYVISAAQFEDITPGNGNVPADALYEKIEFSNSGTAYTPSNTVIATVTWIADADYDGTGSPMTLPITVSVVDYIPYTVKVMIMPSPLPLVTDYMNHVLSNVSFSGVSAGLEYTNTSSATSLNPLTPNVFEFSGVIPANTPNHVLINTITIMAANSTDDGQSFTAAGTSDVDVATGDESSPYAYHTPININSNALEVSLEYSSSQTAITGAHEHVITIYPNYDLAVLQIANNTGYVQPHYSVSKYGATLGLITLTDGCNLNNISLTSVSPTGWLTANQNDGNISLTFGANETGLVRTATLNAFSNLSNGVTPSHSVAISQGIAPSVTVYAAYDYSHLYQPEAFGFYWPLQLVEDGPVVDLPKVPQGGVNNMRLNIACNLDDTFWAQDDVNIPLWAMDESGSGAEGYFSVEYSDGTDNDFEEWITFDAVTSGDGPPSYVYPYRLNVSANDNTTERSATITVYHPIEYQTVTDTIVITQRAAYNPTTDTVGWMYNDGQDYDGIINEGNLPSSGSDVPSAYTIYDDSTGNEDGLAILIKANNLPPKVHEFGAFIYHETGQIELPSVSIDTVAEMSVIHPAGGLGYDVDLFEDTGNHTYDYWFLLPINPNTYSYYLDPHVERAVDLKLAHPNNASNLITLPVRQAALAQTTFKFNQQLQEWLNSDPAPAMPESESVDYHPIDGDGFQNYPIPNYKLASSGTTMPFVGVAGTAHRVPNNAASHFSHNGDNYFFDSGTPSWDGSGIQTTGSYTQGADPSFTIDTPSNTTDYPIWQLYGVRSNGLTEGDWEDTLWVKIKTQPDFISVHHIDFGTLYAQGEDGGDIEYISSFTTDGPVASTLTNTHHLFNVSTSTGVYKRRVHSSGSDAPTIGNIKYYSNYYYNYDYVTEAPTWATQAPNLVADGNSWKLKVGFATNPNALVRVVRFNLNHEGMKIRCLFKQ